ncbi:hypothetical protein ACFQ6Q_33665 [Streptomyces sp. NPDC056437]|uniref:hypothetical protein n=1 Tax=Streptomyces sp. NPDC056437 TaxID=3345816 RepID=UPI0036BFE7FF
MDREADEETEAAFPEIIGGLNLVLAHTFQIVCPQEPAESPLGAGPVRFRSPALSQATSARLARPPAPTPRRRTPVSAG